MEIEMAIYKSRFACIVSTLVAAMFLSACGLKDDLYIPTEETEAQTAETQTTEEENDGENPGPLSTTAP